MQEPADTTNERLKWCRMLLKREIARLEQQASSNGVTFSGPRNGLWLQQIGDSLAKASAEIIPGTSEIAIVNIHTGLQETVPVNPKLSAQKNAELYFKKAKKALRSGDTAAQEQASAGKILERLRSTLHRLNTTGREDIAETVEDALKVLDEVLPGCISGAAATPDAPPYRRIALDGWDIYIGKTDEQNDELSLEFAAPADIWFHVAGNAGSHVIIKRPKGFPEPPEQVINAAASLSAWYSKVRNAPVAEVHMTEARHVRKRQGAPAGEVMVERWKSLRVPPRSPEAIGGN